MWKFGEQVITSHNDLHPDCSYIVYVLHYENGQKYIGKKSVRTVRRLKPTKKQLEMRKNYVRKEMVNIPFIGYEGSLDKTDCPKLVSKEILHQCSNKRTATYMEVANLFASNALFSDEYLNKNIGGVYFDNALDGLIPTNPP